MDPEAARRRFSAPVWRERFAIVLLTVVTVAPWIGGLGYYHDDWAFLAQLQQAADQSLAGLYRELAVHPWVAARPPQILLYIFYDKVLPPGPFWPHAFNAAMFLGSLLLLHKALLRIPALVSSAFPLVLIFASLPHFTTQKFWFANHQSTLSLLLFALAFHIVVRGQAERSSAALQTAVLAPVGAASMLAYELLGALLVALPAFVYCALGGRPLALLRQKLPLAQTAALLAAFVATNLFKIVVAAEMVAAVPLWRRVLGAGWLYLKAAVNDFWTLGLYLPRAACGIATGPFASSAALLAALLAVVPMLIGLRARPGKEAGRPVRFWLASAAIAFVLAHVSLLPSFYIAAGPFGIDNRTTVGAAFAVALGFYGLVLLVGARLPRLVRPLIVIACLLGVFVQVSLGMIWAEADRVQQRVYDGLLREVGPLREGDTLLLQGTCPYHGTAPLFTASWGLAERLQIDHRTPGIRADVLSRTSRVTPAGIAVALYGEETTYPYGALTVYDAREERAYRIGSYEEALRFFARRPLSRATGCEYVDGEGTSLYR